MERVSPVLGVLAFSKMPPEDFQKIVEVGYEL